MEIESRKKIYVILSPPIFLKIAIIKSEESRGASVFDEREETKAIDDNVFTGADTKHDDVPRSAGKRPVAFSQEISAHLSPFLSPLTPLSKLSRIGDDSVMVSPLKNKNSTSHVSMPISGALVQGESVQDWISEAYGVLVGRAKNTKWRAILDEWMSAQIIWKASQVSYAFIESFTSFTYICNRLTRTAHWILHWRQEPSDCGSKKVPGSILRH